MCLVYMKRISITLTLVALAVAAAFGRGFTDESLPYRINYKWGLINKQAGRATLTLKAHDDHYATLLTAASEPWADRIYMVRDTLRGLIDREGFRSTYYEKIAHEGGEDKHDVVRFVYNDDGTVTGLCERRVAKKGKVVKDERRRLDAEGVTVDMLSAYYYMRSLPYENWRPGHTLTVNIFSGKRKELLAIKYHGLETVSVKKRNYRCYHITFIFTSDGAKKTSDDMDAWISADDRRIPIKLEGKLPVGKVHCLYDDN